MYAQTKGSSVLQPLLDIPMDIHIRKSIIAEIKVKEQIFYDKYSIERYTEGFNIYVGKSMQFTFPYGKKGKFDFKVRGTLSDYIQDTKCFIAIIENREVTINNVRIPFDNLCNVAIEQYKRNLLYYCDVKKMLGILGVKGELECDELTDQDKNNIRNFTNALALGRNINFREVRVIRFMGGLESQI